MSLLSELSIQLTKADAALEAQPQLLKQIADLFDQLLRTQNKLKASEACVAKLIDINQTLVSDNNILRSNNDGLIYAKTQLEAQIVVLSEQVAAIDRILHPQPVFMGQIALPPVQWVVKDPPTHAQDDNQTTLALFCPGLVDKTVDEETLPQWLKDMAA